MADLRAWHRWLAVEGDGRPVARAITGWSNFLFLFIVCSGFYLWFPRKWRWAQVCSVVILNPAARGKGPGLQVAQGRSKEGRRCGDWTAL